MRVHVTPAQGRARVQVLPEESGALGRRPVYINWQRMRDTGKSPKEYLDALPRTFPPLMPRHASTNRWWICHDRIRTLLLALRKGRVEPATLEALGSALNTPDQSFKRDRRTGSRYATAVDSEGHPPGGLRATELDEFVELLCTELPRDVLALNSVQQQIIRALGYTSTPRSVFQGLLSEAIQSRGTRLPPFVVEAIGWCLRDAADCSRFAEVVALLARRGDLKLHWIKAMAHLVRCRADALRVVASPTAERLCEHFGKVFQQQRKAGRGAYLFRYSAIAIVFSLRRRIYDPEFLSPDSSLAWQLKQEFAKAFFASTQLQPHAPVTRLMRDRYPDLAKAARPFSLHVRGGAFDMQAALVQLIDYIDRHGRGYIQLSPEAEAE